MKKYMDEEAVTHEKNAAKKQGLKDRQKFILDKYEQNGQFRHYFQGELSNTQSADLRWILDLSKKRVSMAKRVHKHRSKFGQMVAQKMAAKAERRIQALAEKVSKQRAKQIQGQYKGGARAQRI